MSTTTGSCVCKKVTYEYTGEPVQKAACHCKECQKLSGSAFTYNFLVPRENFKFTSGTPKHNSFIQESGVEIGYDFCSDCGAVLRKQAEADAFKPFYMVQAGTIDSRPLVTVKPDAELWTTRKAEWLVPIAGVAQMEQFS